MLSFTLLSMKSVMARKSLRLIHLIKLLERVNFSKRVKVLYLSDFILSLKRGNFSLKILDPFLCDIPIIQKPGFSGSGKRCLC